MIGILILIGMAWAHVFCGYNSTEGQVYMGISACVLEGALETAVIGTYIGWKGDK